MALGDGARADAVPLRIPDSHTLCLTVAISVRVIVCLLVAVSDSVLVALSMFVPLLVAVAVSVLVAVG